MKFLGKNKKIKQLQKRKKIFRIHREVRSYLWHEEKPGEKGHKDNSCKLVRQLDMARIFGAQDKLD